MLPNLNKKNKSKPKTKTKPNKKSESRMGKLAGVALDYAVARPAKFVGDLTLSGLMKELPEVSMLTNFMADFIGDISDTFKKKKISNDTEEKDKEQKSEKSLSEVKLSIDSLREELEKQTHILSSDLSQIKIELGMLDNIYGEIRTLSKITAKVWDVQDKTLRDTRYRQRQQVALEKKKLFADRVSKIDNQTLQENLDSLDPVSKQDKPKGMLENILGSGTGIIDVVKNALGIGAGVGIGSKLMGALTKPILSILRAVIKPLGVAASKLMGALAKPILSILRAIIKPLGVAASSLMLGKYLGEMFAEMIVTDEFVEKWDNAIDTFKKSWDSVTSYASELVKKVTEPAMKAFDGFKNYLKNAVSTMTDIMKNSIKSVLDMIPNSIKSKHGMDITENSITLGGNSTPEIKPLSPAIISPIDTNIEMQDGKPVYTGATSFNDLLKQNDTNLIKNNFEEKRASSLELEKAKEDIQTMSTPPIIIQPQQINAPTTNTNNSRTNINVLGGNSWRDKQLANMSNGIAP